MRYGTLAKVEYDGWMAAAAPTGRVPSYPTFARHPYFIEDEGNCLTSENFPFKSGEVSIIMFQSTFKKKWKTRA